MSLTAANQIVYSVVVPCYNTGEVLIRLAKRLDAVFNALGEPYELILVNDASPKVQTWDTITALATSMSTVVGINLLRNFGQNAATLCGFSEARGTFVITMDDDLQHAPEDIPLLLKEKHHDIVVARLQGRKDRFSRQVTSWIKSYFDYIILRKPREIRLSAFRMISRVVVDNMLRISTPSPFIPALMLQVSRDVVNVPVPHFSRDEGQSNYTLRKRIRLFSLIVINNSSVILQAISYLGALIATFSLIAGIYYFTRPFLGGTPPQGWTSTFVAILFFGGTTMFSIGLIGEYLQRIMEVVEKRPPYVIREIVGSK